jgi:hypothetical protein
MPRDTTTTTSTPPPPTTIWFIQKKYQLEPISQVKTTFRLFRIKFLLFYYTIIINTHVFVGKKYKCEQADMIITTNSLSKCTVLISAITPSHQIKREIHSLQRKSCDRIGCQETREACQLLGSQMQTNPF